MIINPEDKMTFTEAIEFFSDKINIDTDAWNEQLNIDRDAAFTVARAKGLLLQEIRQAVAKGQRDGQSTQEFQKTFNDIADRYSPDWLGKGNRAWRSSLIYEQNLRAAHAAGRHEQMTQSDVMKLRPYWQWRHGGSREPRLSHIALDGKVFDADDLPMKPPCGFNCRCQVFSLSRRDLVREGLEVSDIKEGDTISVTHKGEKYDVVIQPDEGFETKKKASLDDLEMPFRKQAADEIKSLGK